MTSPATEHLHVNAAGLDSLPLETVAARVCAAQKDAFDAVAAANDDITAGGKEMARALQGGGRLFYAAAGSSALMALADACELAGTFGLDASNVHILMAGGLPRDASMPGDTEDDVDEAKAAAADIRQGDAVILVSASGSTPYPITIADIARRRGASTICIANNPGARLFEGATVAICLQTPPEIVAGSTRLGAGTAQKIALNMMSTVMGVALGHIHDGMMVNLRADNDKLRDRAVGMVATIADVSKDHAQTCLNRAGAAVKPAVLLAAGASTLDQAEALLAGSDGHLRAALAALNCRS